MQVDPDTVHPKVPWGNGPGGTRTIGAAFLALAVVNAIVELKPLTTATLGRTVGAMVAGLGWGVVIWLVDRWWDRRPGMHVVTDDFAHEARRRAPAYVLGVLGSLTLYRYGGGAGGLYGATALFVTMGTDFLLVAPTHVHRRYVRRDLRPGLVEPPR